MQTQTAHSACHAVTLTRSHAHTLTRSHGPGSQDLLSENTLRNILFRRVSRNRCSHWEAAARGRSRACTGSSRGRTGASSPHRPWPRASVLPWGAREGHSVSRLHWESGFGDTLPVSHPGAWRSPRSPWLTRPSAPPSPVLGGEEAGAGWNGPSRALSRRATGHCAVCGGLFVVSP